MRQRNPLDELASIIGGDVRGIRLLSVPLLFLCASAFVAIQLDGEGHAADDMRIMLHLAPAWVWAASFNIIAAARFTGLFFYYGTLLSRMFFPFWGMCLWVFCFASNVIGNPADANFSVLYLVAAAMEAWLLGRAFADLRAVLHGR